MAIKFNINGRVERYVNCYLLPEHELGTLEADQFLRERGINDKEPLYKTFSDEWFKIQVDPEWISFSILDKECVRTVGEPNGRKFGFRFSVFVPRSQSFSSAGLVQSLREFKQWGLGQLQSNGLSYQVNPEEWRNVKEKFTRAILQDRKVSLSGAFLSENQLEQAFTTGQTELKKDNTDGIAFRYADDQSLAAHLPSWLEKLGKAGKLSLFPSGSTAAVAMPFGESKIIPEELMEMNDSSFTLLWGEEPGEESMSKAKQAQVKRAKQIFVERREQVKLAEGTQGFVIEDPILGPDEALPHRLKVIGATAVVVLCIGVLGLFQFFEPFSSSDSLNIGDEFVQGGKSGSGQTDNQQSEGAGQGLVEAQDTTDTHGGGGAQEGTGSVGSRESDATQGASSAQGTAGTQGANGSTGAQGVVDTPSATGIAESRESEKTQGAPNAQGAAGAQGANTSSGAHGVANARGATGSAGARGDDEADEVSIESQEEKWKTAKGRARLLHTILANESSLVDLIAAAKSNEISKIEKLLNEEYQQQTSRKTYCYMAFWLIQLTGDEWEDDKEEFAKEWKKLDGRGEITYYVEKEFETLGSLPVHYKWVDEKMLDRLFMPEELLTELKRR